ncbi:uncharacterized protein LOC143292759 [Babylonia areolata]|uniref:uncharacterized protein LOC143292759 n=1 Tax=Babylonia areolata TaxID=304850 RepID=UPI003FD0C07D
MGPVEARGVHHDIIKTKRKTLQCPVCQGRMINLGRHLNDVEHIPRQSQHWQYLMGTARTRQMMADYVEFRRHIQKRRASTIKKEMSYIMECLLALHSQGHLEVIFKIPQDGHRPSSTFMLRVLLPMRRVFNQKGNKVASCQYNKLLAFSTFLQWLLEARGQYLKTHGITSEVRHLHALVNATLVQLRASKKLRMTAINKRSRPMDTSSDLAAQRLMTTLQDEDTWTDMTRVRDTLLTVLTAGTFSRLAVLTNMTTQRVAKDDNFFSVKIPEGTTHEVDVGVLYVFREAADLRPCCLHSEQDGVHRGNPDAKKCSHCSK